VTPLLIRTFSVDCRQRFGQAVGKIPLDLGVPCPNRRYGGCVYCRPAAYTPSCLRAGDELMVQLEQGRKHLVDGRFCSYFAYLQQETSTALRPAELLPILKSLLVADDCRGLILSTRPDYLPQELLIDLAALVADSGKECLVELGLQSAHERSLRLLNRRHSYGSFVDAVARIKAVGFLRVGAHLLFGIPGETEEEMVQSVTAVCALGVDALKLHHLQVLRDTPLADWWAEGKVKPFGQDAYLELLLSILPRIPEGVVLHRLWAASHPADLLAPRWHCHAATLADHLRNRLLQAGLSQGCWL
jgi:radical SAM protein (TIGR01212 family)